MNTSKKTADHAVIAEWLKGQDEVVRVSLGKYRGHRIVSVRVWFRSSDNTFLPGRNGISLAVMHVAKIRKALKKAEQMIRGGRT